VSIKTKTLLDMAILTAYHLVRSGDEFAVHDLFAEKAWSSICKQGTAGELGRMFYKFAQTNEGQRIVETLNKRYCTEYDNSLCFYKKK
jgi:hypothetical protein